MWLTQPEQITASQYLLCYSCFAHLLFHLSFVTLSPLRKRAIENTERIQRVDAVNVSVSKI